MRALTAVLALALALPAAAHAAPVDAPVAVMPFKNLNQSADLAWLSQGIAETMIADLRKTGRIGIVERSQISSAIKEIQVQSAPGSEVARAVAVGKLVGARTIVVGSYQKAGGQLRITARFVTVETGVVTDTAKTTGPTNQIFALQDQITRRLLGLPATPKPQRRAPAALPTRKKSKKEARAYELYAMSLSAATDAQRVKLLKKALDVDPDLVYAADDLRSLEQRMSTYSRISSAKLSEREKRIREKLYDEKTPTEERIQLAKALLDGLLNARRYHTLAGEAKKIYEMDLPATLLLDVRELASWCLVLSHERLRLIDLALQHGERHLKEFPAGPHFRETEKLMNKLVAHRRDEKERRAEYATELKENEAERQSLLKEHDGKIPADRRVDIDYKPCIAAKWSRLPTEMIENCTAFIRKYQDSDLEDAKEFTLNARSYILWGHSLRGEFNVARDLADELKSEAPGQLADIGLQEIIDTRWPTD